MDWWRRRARSSASSPPAPDPPAPAAAGADARVRRDWPFLIGHLLVVRTELVELEAVDGEAESLPIPHLGAAAESLDLLALALGRPLDPLHRSLLAEVDGWSSILWGMDLLTTGQLASPLLRAILRDRWELALERSEHDADQWEVIAARQDLADLVAVGRSGTAVAGQVLWWAQQEVDRYEDLVEWFASVIAYHRLEITRLDATAPSADPSLLTTSDD